MFGGDVSFAGVVKYNRQNGRCTYNESFSKIKTVLDHADFVVINFESPVEKSKENLNSNNMLDSSKSVHLISKEESIDALM